MLVAENVCFSYSRGEDLLHDLSFTVNAGDTVCLLGPNGAGKTTLLRCLLGISRVTSGRITLNGHPVHSLPAAKLSRIMAYVPQAATTVFPHSVLEMVVMGRTPHLMFAASPGRQDLALAAGVLEELGIDHLAERNFSQISGGERQLTLLARALAQQAELLVLDEPTASLDYGNQVRILQTIGSLAKRGYTIIMTSHFPNYAFLTCNKVIMLQRGRLVAMGSPDDVVTEAGLSELYATKVRIVTINDAAENPVKVCLPLL